VSLGSGQRVTHLDRLLREVKHVAGEQRGAVLLEEALVFLEHAIEPRQQLLCAVVRMKNDRDAIGRGNGADVVGLRAVRRQRSAAAGEERKVLTAAIAPTIEAVWSLLSTPLPAK
jgi:hypothetical protein